MLRPTCFLFFFHYSPRWRPPRSRTRPPFPRSHRWRRELAGRRIKPTRFELLRQSFLHTFIIRTRPTRFEHLRLSFFAYLVFIRTQPTRFELLRQGFFNTLSYIIAITTSRTRPRPWLPPGTTRPTTSYRREDFGARKLHRRAEEICALSGNCTWASAKLYHEWQN